MSATTISRALEEGCLVRIGRGLYQRVDAEPDADINLAETAVRVPDGVICLSSALAFHGLTDLLPRRIWIAIGAKSWSPKVSPVIRIVRFREPYRSGDIERHSIAGVDVGVYSVTKSLADAFRNPRLVEQAVALESLKSALRMRKATPAEIMTTAVTYRAAKVMRPYLEALTIDG